LLQAKLNAGSVARHPDGQAGLQGDDFLRLSAADILIEAASTNFQDAEPGWGYVRKAIARDMDVVLASKGSLALFWDDLFSLAEARAKGVFSGTIGAPLPSLEIASRALVGTNINGFRRHCERDEQHNPDADGAGRVVRRGRAAGTGIGIAETDPTLDVDGWDAAAKTVIMANAVLGARLGLPDVKRTGIRGIEREQFGERDNAAMPLS
jgi:homoserine dehydrogenase